MVHRRTPFFPPHITEQRQAGAAGSGATLTWVRFPPWTLSSALGWWARISTPALTAEGKMTAGMCTYEVSALSFDESTIWGVSSPGKNEADSAISETRRNNGFRAQDLCSTRHKNAECGLSADWVRFAAFNVTHETCPHAYLD